MNLLYCFIAQESSFSELHRKRELCTQMQVNLICAWMGGYVILKTNYLKPFAFHFGIFNKI